MNSAPAKTAVGEAGPQILHQRHAVSVFHTQQLRVGCGMRQQDVMGAAADPGLVLLIGGKPETPRPFGFHPLVPVPFGQRRGEPRRRRQHQRVSRDGIGLQVAECEPWRLPAGQGAAQPDLTDMHQACSQCRRQRSHTFFHGGNGLQAGIRGSLPGRLRVGPLPASSAESAYDHVDIAGNSRIVSSATTVASAALTVCCRSSSHTATCSPRSYLAAVTPPGHYHGLIRLAAGERAGPANRQSCAPSAVGVRACAGGA